MDRSVLYDIIERQAKTLLAVNTIVDEELAENNPIDDEWYRGNWAGRVVVAKKIKHALEKK